MIPASYLFKDVYRQSWEDADPLPQPGSPRAQHVEGLMSQIASAIAALFARRVRPMPVARCLRGPACE